MNHQQFRFEVEPFEFEWDLGEMMFEGYDTELANQEWEGEVKRSSPDYVKWVQQSLNQIMGLRLAVDGDLGTQTRSAIRSFQQRQGLKVDGIVGDQTEAAIKAALGGGTTSGGCTVLDGFAFDKDTIKPTQQARLAEIAKRIVASHRTASPIGAVRLIGHTDPVGSAAYNLELGRRRADQVRVRLTELIDQLQRGLVAKIAFTVDSQGERQPISSDPAANRRVEVCPEIKPKPIRPVKPGDQDTDYKRWFTTGGTPAMQPIRSGNQARSLVGGPATFKAMVNAMRTADSKGHYIYLINWHVTDNFELLPGDRNSTVQALLGRASQNGVQVRALLSGHNGNSNAAAGSHINALANGAAIVDRRTVTRSTTWPVGNFGSHHQKILIVKGREGLIAFCGGVDLNPDRIRASSSSGGSGPGSGSGSGSGSGGGGGGAPLHDVHCRISGPAAHDVLRIFSERWQDHPAHSILDIARGKLLGLSEPVPGGMGKHYVQIARTYGNGRRHSGVSGGYRFAPNGERTARRMILHAISQARRFIYLEDQYLVSMEVSAALVRALPRIQHLTIVIPHTSLLSSTECPQEFKVRRAAFIAPLVAAGGGKVRIFHLHPPGAPNTYVHSKMWVIDDEFAIIGSANCNRRSYTHDSEVTAGIYDPDRSYAKELRIALWAKHLNMDTSAGRAALADGVASARFWLSPPSGAHVAPFNHLASVSTGNAPRCLVASWDAHIDPDGS